MKKNLIWKNAKLGILLSLSSVMLLQEGWAYEIRCPDGSTLRETTENPFVTIVGKIDKPNGAVEVKGDRNLAQGPYILFKTALTTVGPLTQRISCSYTGKKRDRFTIHGDLQGNNCKQSETNPSQIECQ